MNEVQPRNKHQQKKQKINKNKIIIMIIVIIGSIYCVPKFSMFGHMNCFPIQSHFAM